MRTILIGLGLLAAGAALANQLWVDDRADGTKPPAVVTPAKAPAVELPAVKLPAVESPASATGQQSGNSIPTITDNPRMPERMLELPDGTFTPSLNGATQVAPLAVAWNPAIPFSRIVRQERASDGIEWYVHADGSRSTTQMVFRAELGRMDAVTRVAHPGGEAPSVPGGQLPGKK